ncbi:MAG: DUF5320 domain-containing protein [Candidatus Eiseniibacteriota bacterium]|nr:MAG: DUF5320 domain-containing protein [Candidatus Eisenbacteria bacterium]
MPGGDRSGPAGAGPRTGRGAGLCAGYPTPGYMNAGVEWSGYAGGFGRRSGFGRGFRFGRGRGGRVFGEGAWLGGGRGWRYRFWATGVPGWALTRVGHPAFGNWAGPWPSEPTAAEETELLLEQERILKKELRDVQQRIRTLDKARDQEKE